MSIQMQAAAAAPSEFVCPISLEIMQDPVILCTGITYERGSIRKWLSRGHRTCPVTMQHLSTPDLIPNLAAAKFIQSWIRSSCSRDCRADDPDEPYSSSSVMILQQQVGLLVDDLQTAESRVGALKKLVVKVKESEEFSRLVVEAGAISVLSCVISSSSNTIGVSNPASEYALAILSLLPMRDSDRRALASPHLLKSISSFLHEGSTSHSKLNATILLGDLAKSRILRHMVGSTTGLFEGFTKLLQQNHTNTLKIAILRTVMGICLPRAARVRAVECGMSAAVVELLLVDDAQKELCEHALGVLELFCSCAEGRAAISQHPLAIPAIAAKVFQVSSFATDSAVSCLRHVRKYSPYRNQVQKRVAEACQVAKHNFKPSVETSILTSPKHLVVEQFLQLCNPDRV